MLKGVTANPITLKKIFDACNKKIQSKEKALNVSVNDQKNDHFNFTIMEKIGQLDWNLKEVFLYHVDTLDIRFSFQECGRFFINNCFDTTCNLYKLF